MKKRAKRSQAIQARPKLPSSLRLGHERQGVLTHGYSLPQMVEDLRKYQAELEIQNRALRYSQAAAEGASERFLTLFSNVPLALMVVDENGLVLESNAMALRLFRPTEHDAPLNFLLPLVGLDHVDKVAQAFSDAKQYGTSET
jgi:PAS domain-containing protein